MARPKKPLSGDAEGSSLPRDLIEYGRISGSYGVRGWLKVVVDEPELLAAAPLWWIGGVAWAVKGSRSHSGTLVAKLDGIENPEQAQQLKGKSVEIPRPQPGEGSYYWSDLVGLEVVNEQGQMLGVVQRMFSNGAHDVMALAGERERLLPWVPPVVKKVDLQARRIEVAWGADW